MVMLLFLTIYSLLNENSFTIMNHKHVVTSFELSIDCHCSVAMMEKKSHYQVITKIGKCQPRFMTFQSILDTKESYVLHVVKV